MKRWLKRIAVIALLVMVGFWVIVGIWIGPKIVEAVRHQQWLDSRKAAFSAYTPADWIALRDACLEVPSPGYDQKTLRQGGGKLPEALQRADPKWLYRSGDDVDLMFSGGHFQFVHITYGPGEGLRYIAEGERDEIVAPAK